MMPESCRIDDPLACRASDILKRYGSKRDGHVHWTDRVTWERDGEYSSLLFLARRRSTMVRSSGRALR